MDTDFIKHWSIRSVEICLYHNRLLVNRCPHCERTQRHISKYHKVGYCSTCKKWLGSFNHFHAQGDRLNQLDRLEWQVWVVTNIGQLIAAEADVQPPEKERVAKILAAFSKQSPRVSFRGLADWLQMDATRMIRWCNGICLPQLTSLLHICYCFNITLLDFFTNDEIVKDIQLYAPPNKTPYTIKSIRRPISTSTKEELRIVLNKRLKKTPPPSLSAVTRELEINEHQLRLYFPELCRKLAARYKQHRHKNQIKLQRSVCEEVKRLSIELHEHGIEPTRGKISVRMNKSGYFQKKEVQDALTAIRQQLGYEND